MPGFYRKKKRKVGPSKNEQKVQRGRMAEAEASAAGTLASRVPGARGLKIKISVASPQGVVLEEAEDAFGPEDAFQIEADCPGRCGSGSYDFAEGIVAALLARQVKGSIQTACVEPLYGGGPENCACIATCAFEAELSA